MWSEIGSKLRISFLKSNFYLAELFLEASVKLLMGMCADAAAVGEGLVGAVGVCNYDVDQLKQFHSLMTARSIPVVSNQASLAMRNASSMAEPLHLMAYLKVTRYVRLLCLDLDTHKPGYMHKGCRKNHAVQVKYNLFERKAEKIGLLQLCKDLNVTLVAHSPLQQGLLTGELRCLIIVLQLHSANPSMTSSCY